MMLFIKYMSDLWKDKREQYEIRYQGDAQRVERALARERFVVPPQADFDYLYARRRESNIGELINIALEKIEDANKAKLENVFRNIDFNSEPHLGQTRERNRRLVSLLVAHFTPAPLTLAIFALIFAWLSYATVNVNYAVFAVFITAYIVFLLALAHVPEMQIAHLRALCTAIGGGLALMVRLIVIYRRRDRLRKSMAPAPVS